ncbi:hypothetical protein [Helicobacter sp. WB40]|uniref:hypothetical protein n=1 Tax=Helicobacter sp. WB40 TaxID=3004130 RepID=UPI0022EBCF45|nr:hypothetical protein [Helicobacter sp. WB40]MDA3967655.1 hypothetical protein [Helicobacter sp. WB40]
MECDVLIYEFGYTGKKALQLCETFSLSYLIIDDGLNIKTIDKFINLNSLKSCKLALICVCDKKEIQKK